MKTKKILFLFFLCNFSFSFAADIRMIVESASRSPKKISDLPVSAQVIDAKTASYVSSFPDEYISFFAPGLDSSRNLGDIYDRTPSITMRGFGIGTQGGRGQGRVLVLLDGVPLNNSALGSVNWNDISFENIERVEIVKGPASSLYGSNALAGVINIITKKTSSAKEVSVSYGSYDSLEGKIKAGIKIKNMSAEISGSYLESGGYMKALPQDRNQYSEKSWLREKNISAKTEFNLKSYGLIKADFLKNYGIAGLGTNYGQNAKGEYRAAVGDYARISWESEFDDTKYKISSYYQKSDQDRKEGTSPAKLTDIEVERGDKGLMLSASKNLFGFDSSFGLDFKRGYVDGYDDYLNGKYSKDKGKIESYSPYVRLEKKILSEKLTLASGARYDSVRFYDGYALNTYAPGFFSGDMKSRNWNRISPSFSAGFDYSESFYQYASYSQGFRAGELENMVLILIKGGGSNKWYQKPNPDLGPEKSQTVETGFRINKESKVFFEPSFYYTQAEDFIYQIYTGVIDPSYGKEKIYENMAKVRIYGAEFPLRLIFGNYSLSASYARSDSKIMNSGGLGINGKTLTYAPKHIYSAALIWKKRDFSLFADWKHKSGQYADDANSYKLSGYSVAAAGFEKKLGRGFFGSFKINNIFNERFQQSDSQLAPGRTFWTTLKKEF
ncbi:MAG: TonB-dependent receptor [Elusimicrobia bacterium]|nr:TonB-dependent receptor [Elusimicrobiota bacterium]